MSATVLHLIESAGPGGAESVFATVIERLDRSRWRSVAVVPEDGWLAERLRGAGHDPIILRERRMLDAAYWVRLQRLVRRERVVVIHAHLFGSCVRAGLLSHLTGVPAIGTLHGPADVAPHERFIRLKFRLLRRLRAIATVSESLRSALHARGLAPEARTLVVPNGVRTEAFRGAVDRRLRSEFGAGEDAFLVGAIGNQREDKGYDVLLRAASLLYEDDPTYRFVVVGDTTGPVADRLVRLRDAQGLSSVVHFAGMRADVPRVMHALDLFVLTSRREGFSLATAEAMAAGMPVVATRCGGPEELIEDGVTGVLVETDSPTAVADGIARLRADVALRRSLASAARKAADARFDIEAQVRTYERLYERCLA